MFLGFLVVMSVLTLLWLAMGLLGLFPFFSVGLLGVVVLWGVGLVLFKIFLFFKVVVDRVSSSEDDYYSKNVER